MSSQLTSRHPIPGYYDDARYGRLLAEVDHPDGFFHEGIVQHDATLTYFSVHSFGGLSVNPVVLDVSLAVASVVDERFLLIGEVLDWMKDFYFACFIDGM